MLKAWGHLASALCCAAPPFAAQASSLFLTHEIHAARFQHGVELKDWSQEPRLRNLSGDEGTAHATSHHLRGAVERPKEALSAKLLHI